MYLASWLKSIRNRASSTKRRPVNSRRRLQSEHLEKRTLLTVTGIAIGTELTVFVDSINDITVQRNTTTDNIEILENGVPAPSVPLLNADTLTGLHFLGGDQDNSIDVSALTTTAFPVLTTITVDTGNGDDVITGSDAFAESLAGGDGHDILIGNAGNDTLDGGDGNDILLGLAGDDSILGGDGADTLEGDTGNDTLNGGNGNDSILAAAGDDSVNGGQGADVIDGGTGNDSISGSSGNDTITGDVGDDTIFGGADDDSIVAGTGDDSVSGDSGNDVITGDEGNDTLDGGDGDDVVSGAADDDLVYGGGGNDTVSGNDGVDILYGGGGHDVLDGGLGDDTLRGNSGNDTLIGGLGTDLLDGDAGDDLLQSVTPALAINDAVVGTEGDAGTTTLVTLTVSLTNATEQPVVVAYSTADGTATVVDGDYDFASGTLTFLPGVTSQTITLTVNGDDAGEPDESFFLNLTVQSGSVGVLDSQAEIQIFDDDVDSLFGTTSLNFAGAGNAPLAPPDTNGDVGLNHYVQARNDINGTLVTIFNKSDGSIADGPFNLSSLAPAGSIGVVGDGDPVVLYDELADRWLLAEFTVSGGENTVNVYISTTSTPSSNPADWYYYNFAAPNFPDYPKVSVWPDGYYVTTNEFGAGGPEPAVYVLDRTNMLLGQPARAEQRVFAPALAGFGFQALTPVDFDGSATPAAGNEAYFLRHRDDEAHNVGSNDPTRDFVELWGYTTDLDNAANSSFQLIASIPVSEFDSDLNGLFAFNAIPQPGTTQELDPLREVVMWQSSYRNFGTHESIVGNFVTDVDGTDHAGIRWFELRRTGGGSWTLYQEGDWAPDAENRWMGAIEMDAAGNIALAYSISSSTVFPGLRYTGRRAGDPLGQMTQGEYTIIDGTTSQLGTDRWGDYQSLTVDPVDGSTFWFTGQYGTGNSWSTQIATFAFSPATAGGGSTPSTTLIVDTGDTLLGGDGNDTLVGASGDDTLDGGAGNDSLTGNDGNDLLTGGDGKDTLNGGNGDDTLSGQGANDVLDGGTGVNDILWDGANNGDDVIVDSRGVNRLIIQGSDSAETYTVDEASNQVRVSSGNASVIVSNAVAEVRLLTGGGNDTVTITSLANAYPVLLAVDGEAGDDVLTAAGANTGRVRIRLNGGDGNDAITGGTQNDYLNGDAGEDTISGGSGDDQINGGDGNDELYGDRGNDVVDGGIGNDTISGGIGDDSLSGSFDDDYITGDRGNDTISGGFGNDIVVGNSGADLVDGNQGDDSVYGGAGDDSLDGGAGNDYMRGHSGNDVIKGGDGDDSMYGDSGDDTMSGGDGDDIIEGRDGFSVIDGGDGNDKIVGGAYNDTLIGGDGNDTIFGGAGNDRIYGGDGDDILKGHGSTDLYNSGEGDDTLIGLTGKEYDNLNLQIGANILKALAVLNGF